MSGSYASSGVQFLNGTLPLLAALLASGGSGLTLADCVSAVTYHAYTSGPPENTYDAFGINTQSFLLAKSNVSAFLRLATLSFSWGSFTSQVCFSMQMPRNDVNNV